MTAKQIWNWFGDRLGSTILHPQYFVKIAENHCLEIVKKHVSGVFLDIGCGRQWYRNKIEKYVSKYYAMDHPEHSKKYQSIYPVEIYADASSIPLSSNSINTALMLMVLEHLSNPEKALQEAHRILKKSGYFIICTVENYPGHDLPQNFYHFTKYGLREILERCGFRIIKMESFGNFWETQAVMQNVYLMRIVKSVTDSKTTFPLGLLILIFFAPIIILGNIVALFLGKRKITEEFALGHIVIASKK